MGLVFTRGTSAGLARQGGLTEPWKIEDARIERAFYIFVLVYGLVLGTCFVSSSLDSESRQGGRFIFMKSGAMGFHPFFVFLEKPGVRFGDLLGWFYKRERFKGDLSDLQFGFFTF